MNLGERFEKGKVSDKNMILASEQIEYTPHKLFKGVFLKHLVKGDMTGNQISCHLVKIEPFCVLDNHIHEESLEIHEVIAGEGICYISENKIEYTPGTIGVVPKGTIHRITAGKDGVYILAKFTPSLL